MSLPVRALDHSVNHSRAHPARPFVFFFLKLVMEDIFISGDPLLESVGLHEPLVEELRANITNAMHKAMMPLQAYAKEYRKYLELNNNDISTFLKYVYVRVCMCVCMYQCACVCPSVCLSDCVCIPSHPANHSLLSAHAHYPSGPIRLSAHQQRRFEKW